jgi:transcriptional regulator with XRE-family HTH domain
MQTQGDQAVPSGGAVGRTFGERAKATRIEAGMTQLQLQERLETEFGIKLDTSGITRIEAGQREPRLSEALAIAAILDFGLNNLTPTGPDLDFYMSGVVELMHESRETLLKLLRSVDQVTEFVQRNPGCVGDDGLESIFQNEFEWFRQELEQEPLVREDQQTLKFAVTTDKSDEKLKRQLLRVVTADLLVSPKMLNATTDDPTAGRLRERTESRLIAEQWEQNFNQLLRYVEHHGHARVPQFYTVDGRRLGMWVVAQRNRHAKGTVDHDRARQLEALPGWTWRPRADQWEEGFRRLVDYIKRNGDARVPQSYIVDGYKLGAWAARQRHAEDTLDADRARRLEGLPGWTWDRGPRTDRTDAPTKAPRQKSSSAVDPDA